MNTKNILTGMLLLVFLFHYDFSIAQEKKEKYIMYTTVQIKPIKGKENELEKAVLSHNERFHKEGAHQAYLRKILTGPKAGNYVWISGPKTFSDFDSSPGDGAHNDDLSNNVDQYVKHYGTIEHWKRNDELSFTAPNTENNKLSEVWFIDIKKGKGEQFKGALAKAIAVSTKKGDETIHTYNTSYSGGDGRDVAMVFSFEKWADLDLDDPFKDHFEALHGEGSWKEFLDDWTSSTVKIVQLVTKLVE